MIALLLMWFAVSVALGLFLGHIIHKMGGEMEYPPIEKGEEDE